MLADNRIRYLLVLASVLLAAYIIWKDDPETDKPDTTAAEEARQDIDSFVSAGEFITYDKTGKVRSVIRTAHSEHFPATDSASLQQPEILFYQRDRQPWHLSAQTGRYQLQQEQLNLNGEVNIRQTPPDPNQSPWLLTTESLFIDYKSRFISTDQQVKISDGNAVLSGTGMESHIDDREIKLLSNVRGSYVPNAD